MLCSDALPVAGRSEKVKDQRPLIIDIKRHALHDGPGIRTTVFFKGCPLRCIWCHNPETMDPGLEIGFYPADCIQCGECVKVCPTGAAQIDLEGRIDREICQRCGKCAEACPGRGLRAIGRYYDIDELVDIILRDKAYYETSGGGVTLSGGEPALYMDYVSDLLKKLKAVGIHTAIETCGCFEWSQFRDKVLDWLDVIQFDVKLADAELHLKYTGKSNEIILQNLRNLARERPGDLIVRVPLVPGITAEKDNLQKIAGLLRNIGIKRGCLLPYNPLGISKRINIGREKVDMPERMMAAEEINRLVDEFSGIELVET